MGTEVMLVILIMLGFVMFGVHVVFKLSCSCYSSVCGVYVDYGVGVSGHSGAY